MQKIEEITRREVYSLKSLLLEMQSNLPSFGPQKLLRALTSISDQIANTFEAVTSHSFSDNNEKQMAYTFLLRKVALIHSKFLKFLTSQPPFFSPSELLLPLLTVAKSFETKSFVLSLWPGYEYNYEVEFFRNLVKKELDELTTFCRTLRIPPKISIKEDFPTWFIEICFPHIEGRNALLQCILLHEIAHLKSIDEAIAKELSAKSAPNNNLVKSIFHKMDTDQDVRKQILNELQTVPRIPGYPIVAPLGFEIDHVQARMYASWVAIIKWWIDELISDLFAVRILGPAYIFACDEFWRIVGERERYTPTHPSPNFRLTYLLDEIKRMDYSSQNTIPTIHHLPTVSKEKNNKPKKPINPFYEVPYMAVTKISVEILKRVEKDKNIFPYTSDIYTREVPALVKAFRQGIPPSDRWEKKKNYPNNIIAILNAGWEVYLEHLDDFFELVEAKDSKDKALAVENLNDLILKAIEGSEILRIWRET